jgi:hypothetical protein
MNICVRDVLCVLEVRIGQSLLKSMYVNQNLVEVY